MIYQFLILMLAGCTVLGAESLQVPPPPEWAKNLVIYEIATKSFTSPNGPGSGTFQSTKERVPYLAELGINAIWLTGWNLANKHFYGIWTQYATIDPSKIDPSLGTEQDFKELIAELHEYKIKVFLDSTEHGLVNDSPLVKEHPDWFKKKGSWEMTDYDWKGEKGPHPDLNKWWVDYWMRWITEFGVDGARLDVQIGNPAVWAEIKRKAEAAGHAISVFTEAGSPEGDPVSDFMEIANHVKLDLGPIRIKDMAKTFSTPAPGNRFQSILFSCHDSNYGPTGSPFYFGYFMLAPANILFVSGEEFGARYKPLPSLCPDLYGKEPPGPKSHWLYGGWLQWDQLAEKQSADMLADAKRVIGIRMQYRDLIHAGGRGVRLTNIANVEMTRVGEKPDSAAKFSRPFVLWNERHALLVGGNSDDKKALGFTWNVPVDKFGWKADHYKVVDLWGGRRERTMSAEELAKMEITIAPDRTASGGLAVFEISPVKSK